MNFQPAGQGDEEVILEMTPLIDMVFQLLIFFLLTTTFAINVKEGGLELDLPRAKSTQIPAMASHVVIAVLKDGRTVVGGEALQDPQLQSRLQQVHQQNADTLVIVQADRNVEHWRVVKVMDMAATLGLKRLAIATVEE
ncbi:MAG: biopolymer transporter ExbD [Deltaproteobacteria bacterium]|nr:biopolymer transporter ExbD [Deltaproteobacteria bacterium]